MPLRRKLFYLWITTFALFIWTLFHFHRIRIRSYAIDDVSEHVVSEAKSTATVVWDKPAAGINDKLNEARNTIPSNIHNKSQNETKPIETTTTTRLCSRNVSNPQFNRTYDNASYVALLQMMNSSELQSDGRWSPPGCKAQHKVAIIIPFRDRKQHLYSLLSVLHPMLQNQKLEYQIFLAEQSGDLLFNKGLIMNIAAQFALNRSKWDCLIFHDVDLLPQTDLNYYGCPDMPRHLSVAIDAFDYNLPYWRLVGGVLAMKTEHFYRVNGYSNLYWGWGVEDDDMAQRIISAKLNISRPDKEVGRYTALKHESRTASMPKEHYNHNNRIFRSFFRIHGRDGFDKLPTLNYTILSETRFHLYHHILIDVGPPPPVNSMPLLRHKHSYNKRRL